ncbi:MAG TPA: transporter [Cyanobacteria bacterium UBA8530]|nr:transporter [Cyanobacteria bacterium UBA8530]
MAVAQAEETEKAMGFLAQMRSFDRPFWFANLMELVERWSYYGVRAVIALYIVDAIAHGGLEFTHIQKGTIFMWWAIIQSLLPMFTGGFADRYGYKKSIATALFISITGYILMGTQHSFIGFFLGCMLLATGTAVFKPGVQGTLVNSTNSKNSSIGWGIFYMIVNIGGFVGPCLAAYLRVMDWKYVFFASAALLALNYLLLLGYKDIPVQARENKLTLSGGFEEFFGIIGSSVKNIFEPRLISFLIIFSGFWLMFMQLFDILPNFIDDWVNSSYVLTSVGKTFGLPSLVQMGNAGLNIPPEQMINLDAGSIVLLMMPIAWMCGRLKPIVSMMIGMIIASLGLVLAGFTQNGWLCLLGILIFAIGEMASSPKMNEYLGLIAPEGKKGLYMGYANVPLAIGWGFGSALGGYFYQNFADKATLAKRYLGTLGLSPTEIAGIPKEKIMDTLAMKLHCSVPEATQTLWDLNHPQQIWMWFAAIGLFSVACLFVYHLIIERAGKKALAKA